MSELTSNQTTSELSTDIHTITAEINAYQQIAGEAIFEIGRRLKGVRDNPEKYGFEGYRDWERWCNEQLSMSRGNANKIVKVFERFSSDSPVSHLPNSMSVLYELTTFTDEELSETYELPSGEKKKPTEMSRREIEELKRQLKAEQAERERLEQENEDLTEKADKPPEVKIETRTEYIEVDNTPHDYDEVKRRLEDYHERFGDIRNYDDNVTATHVQDMISATMSFKRAVKEFARRFSYMTKYKDAINRMDHISKQEYNETVKALHELADSFEYLDEDNERVIINQ